MHRERERERDIYIEIVCMYTPFPSMFSCQGEKGNIGMLVWGGGGQGGEEGAGGGGGGVLVFPPQTAQIHWRRRNFTAGLGAHLWLNTPPPPHGEFEGWGSLGRGLRGGEWRESEWEPLTASAGAKAN